MGYTILRATRDVVVIIQSLSSGEITPLAGLHIPSLFVRVSPTNHMGARCQVIMYRRKDAPRPR